MDAKKQVGLQDAAERHHDVAGHRRAHGGQRREDASAFIGFSDAYGEGWSQEFAKAAALKKLQIVANERYARSRHLGHRPDAEDHVGQARRGADRRLGHAGRAAAEDAASERGYTGKIYQTHGVANADFLRVGGKDVEGTFLPAGPVLVADQLPAAQSGEEVGAGLRAGLRGGLRQGHASRPSARTPGTRAC